MWPFSTTRSLKSEGFFDTFVDCHTHILYGVDDGVQDVKSSLKILDRYEQLGIKRVWLTPHVMEDVPNTPDRLTQRFEELKQVYTGHIELRLAAEHMLDNLFNERLERDELLPIGTEKQHLLVETSYFNPPMGLHHTLSRVISKGYYPILAHPERYVYMGDVDYKKLRDMGLQFQLNLLSLVGGYGSKVKAQAEKLLSQGYYSYVGSDIHTSRTSEYISEIKLKKRTVQQLMSVASNATAL